MHVVISQYVIMLTYGWPLGVQLMNRIATVHLRRLRAVLRMTEFGHLGRA